jgi:hypothetical protein
MVILEKAIAGYNNILTIATDDMTFGKNSKVNTVRVPSTPVDDERQQTTKTDDKNPEQGS